jgi:uncharacterized OB-fold protein
MAEPFEYFPELKAWAGFAAAGRFVLPTCAACGKAHWYPRGFCPFCDAPGIAWREASGAGVIYAFTANVTPAGPTIVAYVTLQEGPTLLTNIVDASPERLRIGQAVRVVMRQHGDGATWPSFAPAMPTTD